MKVKQALVLVAGLLVIAGMGIASSHTSNNVMTAAHPLYGAKIAGEEGVEGLAPNTTARAQAKLNHAGERADEIEKLAADNRSDLANQTANAYAEEMQEVNDLGSRVSSLAKKQKINELVATATQHHQEVLQTVMEKVPEQARAGIQRALDNAKKGYQQASKRVAESLMEQGRQALRKGNSQLDRGNEQRANQTYTDAAGKFGQAEQWAQKAGPAGDALEERARNSREGAVNTGLSVQAGRRGNTDAAEEYGQQAQQDFKQASQGGSPR